MAQQPPIPPIPGAIPPVPPAGAAPTAGGNPSQALEMLQQKAEERNSNKATNAANKPADISDAEAKSVVDRLNAEDLKKRIDVTNSAYPTRWVVDSPNVERYAAEVMSIQSVPVTTTNEQVQGKTAAIKLPEGLGGRFGGLEVKLPDGKAQLMTHEEICNYLLNSAMTHIAGGPNGEKVRLVPRRSASNKLNGIYAMYKYAVDNLDQNKKENRIDSWEPDVAKDGSPKMQKKSVKLDIQYETDQFMSDGVTKKKAYARGSVEIHKFRRQGQYVEQFGLLGKASTKDIGKLDNATDLEAAKITLGRFLKRAGVTPKVQ